MSRSCRTAICVVLALCMSLAEAVVYVQAVITLKDGSVVSGDVLTGDAAWVVLRTDSGEVRINRADIESAVTTVDSSEVPVVRIADPDAGKGVWGPGGKERAAGPIDPSLARRPSQGVTLGVLMAALVFASAAVYMIGQWWRASR